MASEAVPWWADLFRSCLPRRQRSISDPIPLGSSTHNVNPMPRNATATQGTPTPTIPPVDLAEDTISEAKTAPNAALVTLKTTLEVFQASLDVFPPLKSAVGGLLECILHLQIEERNRRAYEELASDLANLANHLQKHVIDSKPSYVPYSIANVARAISEQTENIKQRQDRSRAARLTLAKDDEENLLRCYRRIGALFHQLQADISLSIWDLVREQHIETRLNHLSSAPDAYFNSALPTTATKRVGCTKNTRIEILKNARSWTREVEAAKIYWMNGMAGTGKTTIAYTMCKMLEENDQLGASFFCSRNSPDCRDVNKIVPTIAYQLGRYSNPYRQALCRILDKDPDVAKRDISIQFENLISKPLGEIGNAMPCDVVVVIDALDECSDIGGTRQILDMLLQHASGLPLRFFVTSRPEPAISDRMAAQCGAFRSILRLHDIEKSLVQADIKTYLTEALVSIQVTPTEIDQLAARAGALFIFAATAVRYIIPDTGRVNHRQRLSSVLELRSANNNRSYRDIDELYLKIVSSALDEKSFDDAELDATRRVLWTVVCAREPLSISGIVELLGMSSEEDVQFAIQPLQSVLHVSENTHVVSTLHASFPDFLLSKDRAGDFHCDEAQQNSYLATRCFELMERLLRFNICGLDSSYRFDSDVPDLPSRIDQKISTGLFYACRYWGDHSTRTATSSPLLLLFRGFLEHRLLFWMEAISLKGWVAHGEAVINQLLSWLPTNDESVRLRQFAHDARNFVTSYAANPTSLSTPHIYISILPFTPQESHVWTTYWPRMQGLIRMEGTAMESRERSALATWGVGSDVNSISQSSDGKRIATGSDDSMVRVWDVSKGTCILGPLEGHEARVWSVAFSPDDTRIASGSADCTIRIWDSRKGSLITEPLKGHTNEVYSVAFSPDGARLASGSGDRTVRMWDAFTGSPLGEPFEGHVGIVRAVAFSPDGKHLASGSTDSTIRLWDSHTGVKVVAPFEGHTGEVYSVAFSPDGLCLASGSTDCTVRVWDLQSGIANVAPFKGHTEVIFSVAFSPNSTQVVSGSSDRTICVWDVFSGTLLAGPLSGHESPVRSVLFTADGTRILSGSDDDTVRVWDSRQGKSSAAKAPGHTGGINSVAFSPDGRRAASSSSDKTICVWDTHDGALVAGPFQGHTADVLSVAFSPDGARTVSGSYDSTLRTWDACTGALLAGPFEGHTGWVRSVAFSPDGSRIASGSDDCTIRMWDSHTGAALANPLEGHTNWVMSVAFSPDGGRVVSGSWDRTVRMWDATDVTALVWTSDVHTDTVWSVAFSADGTRVVSGSNDRTILVLNARDGTVLHSPLTGHTSEFLSIGFSPDGTRVVSSSYDRTVCVWDVQSGSVVVGPLKGHTAGVNSVAFSPGGTRIMSGSDDGTIRFWDIPATESSQSLFDRVPNNDGWVSVSDSQPLFWVPADLRSAFPGILNPFVISLGGIARLDHNLDLLLGERWHECYKDLSDSK